MSDIGFNSSRYNSALFTSKVQDRSFFHIRGLHGTHQQEEYSRKDVNSNTLEVQAHWLELTLKNDWAKRCL